MTTPDPDPDRLDTPDAPPTAGLRCPLCGGEPRLTVEDHAPTFPTVRYHAEVACCGMSADTASHSAWAAADRAAERWALRYQPAEDRDDA
jgi:hypothetical protein